MDIILYVKEAIKYINTKLYPCNVGDIMFYLPNKIIFHIILAQRGGNVIAQFYQYQVL
jgi:hypothetical protein